MCCSDVIVNNITGMRWYRRSRLLQLQNLPVINQYKRLFKRSTELRVAIFTLKKYTNYESIPYLQWRSYWRRNLWCRHFRWGLKSRRFEPPVGFESTFGTDRFWPTSPDAPHRRRQSNVYATVSVFEPPLQLKDLNHKKKHIHFDERSFNRNKNCWQNIDITTNDVSQYLRANFVEKRVSTVVPSFTQTQQQLRATPVSWSGNKCTQDKSRRIVFWFLREHSEVLWEIFNLTFSFKLSFYWADTNRSVGQWWAFARRALRRASLGWPEGSDARPREWHLAENAKKMKSWETRSKDAS